MSEGAERVAELFAADRYAAHLGIELVDPDPGRIVVRMPIGPHHLNFYDTAHGGALFSVADCAFSLASNAHGDQALAIDTHLALTAATKTGDVLTATAEEMTRGRSLATYRIVVRRNDDRVCALFTGTVKIRSAGP